MPQIEYDISGNITWAEEIYLMSKKFYDYKKVRIIEIVLICTLLFVLKFQGIRIRNYALLLKWFCYYSQK